MSSSEIKLFYSWQSDLSGNQTRSVIQGSIEAAVKSMKDTVEIIADRDTKGEYGSPDIVETIFKKIDECDIFIADVSIINRFYAVNEEGKPIKAIKTTPNPNVLLELGYAAHVLGWEKIICIMNTDFGKIRELPFDLIQKRVTTYSLKGSTKAKAREKLTRIIKSTVEDIQESGKRVKGSLSNHIVGAYDFETKNIVKTLIPYEITNSEWYLKERKEVLNKCKEIIAKITEIEIQPIKKKEEPVKSSEVNEVNNAKVIDRDIKLPSKLRTVIFNNNLFERINEFNPVIIKEEDKNCITKNAKQWFNIDLAEDFFYLGNLQSKNYFPHKKVEYIGTEKEKNKYNKIESLISYMFKEEILNLYIKSFDDIYMFPLAIFNSSTQVDKDITVSLKVNNNSADIISPTKELIYEDLIGIEQTIYETGIIKGLLKMPENTEISYDTDISYDITDSLYQMRKTPNPILWNSTQQYDSDDYERELKKYIVSPIDTNNSEIEFNVSDLRPKEKKWLGGSILLRPKAQKVSFLYFIKSQYSSGELCGAIEYEI